MKADKEHKIDDKLSPRKRAIIKWLWN